MATQYERSLATAEKVLHRFVVQGCSWKGRMTRRDGKVVDCGHKHKTHAAAEPCRRRMKKTKPGDCQDYRIAKLEIHYHRRTGPGAAG